MKKVDSLLRELLSQNNINVSSVKRIVGGFNCVVYMITDKNHKRYIAKKYKVKIDDPLDRTTVEYASTKFMWSNGIRTIPEPLCMYGNYHIGVYHFIEGTKFIKGNYTYRDILEVTDFLRKLQRLSKLPDASTLPLAKESSLSITDCANLVDRRLDTLLALQSKRETNILREFLIKEFIPVYRQMRQFINVEAKRNNLNQKSILPKKYHILSPSDFGFHNAMQTSHGIIFYDFEYFGWDDPAKMITDFFLHPKMELPYKLREYFFKLIYDTLDDPTLPKRVALYYIILSFKWSLIMLNEFTQSRIYSRNRIKILKQHLENARIQLNETIAELEMRSFPLSLL